MWICTIRVSFKCHQRRIVQFIKVIKLSHYRFENLLSFVDLPFEVSRSCLRLWCRRRTLERHCAPCCDYFVDGHREEASPVSFCRRFVSGITADQSDKKAIHIFAPQKRWLRKAPRHKQTTLFFISIRLKFNTIQEELSIIQSHKPPSRAKRFASRLISGNFLLFFLRRSLNWLDIALRRFFSFLLCCDSKLSRFTCTKPVSILIFA